MRDRCFIVKGEIYPYNTFVYFGNSKRFLKKVKKVNPYCAKEAKEYEGCMGTAVMFPYGHPAIWIKKKPNTAKWKAILSHEIFHCACLIMDKVGIKLSKESDEAFAYLIEYLTRKIYENLE